MSSCVSDREEYYSVPSASKQTISREEYFHLFDAYFRGHLYEIPFKIGDKAYIIKDYRGFVRHIKCGEVSEIYLNCENRLCAKIHNLGIGEIGKKVFATEEEAREQIRKESGE